ncbi:hypothetical protein V6S67_19835 [Arthrobacter sp. Soc17.1.1.1]|uniref:hypothetical protein n=1 Tax=Arthrobacter sp. Soc17.1.1.1 TaxID=3121277 RepID=UPI002FE4EA76
MTDEFDEYGSPREDEPTPVIVSSADAIYDELRTICHHSLPGTSIPAPVAYKVLGNLKGVEYLLSQALGQLAAGLGKSLDTHDVYEYEDRDPVQSVATATDHLTRAAGLAKQLGAELAQAQNAIAGQGYRD